MNILVFTSSSASPLAVSVASRIEADGHRPFFRSASDYRDTDGVERCDGIWVEPYCGKWREIEAAYAAAGIPVLALQEKPEATRTPVEEPVTPVVEAPAPTVDVTCLDDEAPVRIAVDRPDPAAKSSRRKR